MRDSDRLEVEAMGYEPIPALAGGLRVSTKAWTGLVDGRPCLIGGVCPSSILGGIGVPWLLGTDDISRVRKQFLRQALECRNECLRMYPVLRNNVDQRNTVAIRWLEWLGFDIGPAVELGVNGELFHPFELRAQNVHSVYQ
jgi:hypothetical protein